MYDMMIQYFTERRNEMKRILNRIILLLLPVILLVSCSGTDPKNTETRALDDSAVWTLSERYPVTYSSLHYIATYEAKGESFCVQVNRNAKETGMSKRVVESRDVDGIVFARCESKQKDANGNASYTSYECYTGSFRYFIGRESDGFYIETLLSMDDAISLMKSPNAPVKGISFIDEEWNAQFRTDACNLEILIRPNDSGALVKSLPSSYQEITQDGETYFVSSAGDDIVYTDGTHSVQIRQANRSGQNAPDYHTISECKAILALLGS